MVRKGFSVLDRANLKKILDEHKLSASGLVDPDTAKKLGQFAGVDALILGTIAPRGQAITLTAKIITTDTAEIAGAGRAEFTADSNVQAMLSQTNAPAASADTPAPKPASDLSEDKPKVTKTLGNLVVQLMSLKIVNGDRYLLTMNLTNRSKSSPVWLGLSNRQSILDASGNQYGASGLTGISYGGTHVQYTYGGGIITVFTPSLEVQPGDSTTAMITFASQTGTPAPGVCNVQLEFMVGTGLLEGQAKLSETPNLVAKMEAQ